MAHLFFSFFAAFAVSFSVYGESSSLFWAFLAYSMTGTLVLLVVVAATAVLMKMNAGAGIQAAQA